VADHLVTDTQPSLIEVMAPHCAECRAMQSDLDAVAEEYHETVDLIVINAAEEPERAAALEVLGTPTLIAMRNGVEVARFTGRRSKSELRELFAAVADGNADSISSMRVSDRLVWTVAAVLSTAAGLAIGPSWIMVALGVGLGSYPLIRGRR
jgi:thioredoxin-like negative regulator of GroEL